MTGLYLALGDSMSVDDHPGPGLGAASRLHRERLGGMRLRNLARDGVTVDTVLFRQLELVEERPELVTVTMGGNDLLMAYGDDVAGADAVLHVAETAAVILRRLRAIAGPAPIVLSTVYDPSDGTAWASCDLPCWPAGLALLHDLNAVLAEVADEYGAVLADVHAAFRGHGAAVGDPSQPDPRPANRDLWYRDAVGPNAWGAAAISACWWGALLDSEAFTRARRVPA
jgi:lysophospholipase L1-like esterase